MKKFLIKSVFIIGTMLSVSNATWYRVSLATWSKIEQTPSYIRITTPSETLSSVAQADGTGSFASPSYPNQDEIHITPPSGKEGEWLALVLSSLSMGGTLQFAGTANGSVLEVSSTGAISIMP